jgi:hypothetical protein
VVSDWLSVKLPESGQGCWVFAHAGFQSKPTSSSQLAWLRTSSIVVQQRATRLSGPISCNTQRQTGDNSE